MNDDRDFEPTTAEWLNDGSDATPPHVIDAVLLAARSTPQERDYPNLVEDFTDEAPCVRGGRGRGPRRQRDGALCPEPTLRHRSGTDASRGAVRGPRDLRAGRRPDRLRRRALASGASTRPRRRIRSTRVQLTSEAGIPLGWSSDGTRLLIMRRRGSGARSAPVRPARRRVGDAGDRAADGDPRRHDLSRRVARRVRGDRDTGAAGRGRCTPSTPTAARPRCSSSLEMAPSEDPTFSPDGTQIAYADGAGDHSHSVWVMDADGS